MTKKTANKRKVDNPPVSDQEMDTDSFYEMFNNEDLEQDTVSSISRNLKRISKITSFF